MKCCMNCGYQVHENGDYLCCNDESDSYSDYVESLHTCPEWVSMEEQEDE